MNMFVDLEEEDSMAKINMDGRILEFKDILGFLKSGLPQK